MKWIKILEATPEKGKTINLKISSKHICVVNNEDELFAFTARCPHAGADLSAGWCDKGYWVCPVHRYKYSLQNGRGAAGQGDYLKIYPLEVRDDGIYVGLNKSWWSNWFGLGE